jgi:hypothetical protein
MSTLNVAISKASKRKKSLYWDHLKKEVIRKMSDVEWLEQKLLSELNPELEAECWYRIDNELELMPVLIQLNGYLFKGKEAK